MVASDPSCMQGRVSGILASLKRPTAVKAIAYLRHNAPDFLQRLTVVNSHRIYHRFWQPGSGHDENVSDVEGLHALMQYVHLNPVRRGLVNHPEEWPWSSARDWLQLPDSLLKVDRTLPEALEIPWTKRPTKAESF